MAKEYNVVNNIVEMDERVTLAAYNAIMSTFHLTPATEAKLDELLGFESQIPPDMVEGVKKKPRKVPADFSVDDPELEPTSEQLDVLEVELDTPSFRLSA